jgi:hypothetical protein
MQIFNFLFQLVFVTVVIAIGVIIGDYLGYLLFKSPPDNWIDSTNTKDDEDA